MLCRNHPEMFIRSIRQIITFCKQSLKLEDEHRRSLLKAAKGLGQAPWHAREILTTLRRSYTVPVPGLLCDEVKPAAAEEPDDADAA